MDEVCDLSSSAAGPAGGGSAHIKATVRRKKAASSALGQSQQQRLAGASSASIASIAVVPQNSCSRELLEAARSTAPAGQQQQQQPPPPPPSHHLPPRSPVKATKVCVPTLEDALDDVQVRFVLNLPEAELSSADRLFFQLEQAWWFYEDFIADAHKHLPHFKLKEFAKLLFQHCDALRPLSGKYNELFEYFRSWKGTIPTAGCILLNASMTDVVLVKCWKGNSRGLPKGKINQGEPAIDAAIREVLEETGYDARSGANEKDSLTLYLNGQQTTMFVVVGVDEGFPFEPQVRKEISAIEWFPLDALPKGTFGVEPFIPRLRRWMAKAKGVRAPKNAATPEARTQSLLRVRKARATSPDVSSAAAAAVAASQSQPSSPTGAASSNCMASSKKQGRKGSKASGATGGGSKDHETSSGGDHARACSAPNRRGGVGGQAKPKGYDLRNHDTFGGGGDDSTGGGGGADGWDFEAMLAANERLTGRTFVYDGNPHEFGDPTHAACVSPTARDEDQIGHLKQRGNGDTGAAAGNNRKSGKARGGGRKGGVAPGDVQGAAKSRSRSRGKDKDKDKERMAAKPKSRDNVGTGACEVTAMGDATTSDGGGGGGGLEPSASFRSPAAGSGCSSDAVVVGSLCTEGAGGGEGAGGAPVVSLWGDSPAAGISSTSTGRAGVFGDFKFDVLDILSAVSQG